MWCPIAGQIDMLPMGDISRRRIVAEPNDRAPLRSVLYLSYDGMLEPLGQSQVLAYLESLAMTRPIHLMSFEKPKDWADVTLRNRVQARMDGAGIQWHPRRYHRRPSALATSWDIGVGVLLGLWLIIRHRLAIVHARSYVAGVMALPLLWMTGARFLFDMRGLWADERVDGGLWPCDGRMYQLAKWFERRLLTRADHVVSLTNAAVSEIERFPYLRNAMPPVSVIPTCADLARFAPVAPPDGPFVLGYVGSTGTWYLFDAVVACFAQLRTMRPDARFLVVNRGEHAYVLDRLSAGGVPMDAVEVRAADHAEVPAQMARMHAGVFFIKPVFSKQASAPTKLGEFLGCGIACLSNTGVGDMAAILEGDRVGVAIDEFGPSALANGLTRLLLLVAEENVRSRCVAAAITHFSLDGGVAQYNRIYQLLDKE